MRADARARACASADPAVLAGYMGKSGALDDALASFAMAYADRTQSDYDRLAKAKGNDKDNANAKANAKGNGKDKGKATKRR